MPDYDTVRGEIRISPPLNWTEIQQTETIQKRDRSGPIFVLDLLIDKHETADGLFTKKTCELFVPRNHKHPARNLEDQLRKVVEALPGHEFHGEFVCYGEDPENIWRVVARGRHVEEQYPLAVKIVWPD